MAFRYQPCRDEVLHQLQLDGLLPGDEDDNHHGDAGGVGGGLAGAGVNLGLPAQVREEGGQRKGRGGVGGQAERLAEAGVSLLSDSAGPPGEPFLWIYLLI